MIKAGSKIHKQILEYTLNDYQFLEDYQIIDAHKTNKFTFTAQIKNTTQKVRFIKKKFNLEILPRFKALCKLYKNGIVLADNMFIIQQCEEHYFYIIEAELETDNHRFRNLQQYLYEHQLTEEERKAIVSKIKILMDCLHQEGQPYAGLDVRSIIVDDQNHIYLAPFRLQLQLKTDNFSRAYYPPQLLARIKEGNSQIDEMAMMRWDFWTFGCIAAEVLFYSSPLFLQTSLTKQTKKIKQFTFTHQLSTLDEPMRNAIANSLNQDPIARNISTAQVVIAKNTQNECDLKKTVKNWKKKGNESSDYMTQLNIYKESESGDSELIISLLTLEGMAFEDELHLTVHLNKKYHFYIDHAPDTCKYKLNKTITIRNDFTELAKLLQAPVKMEAKHGSKVTTIFINLQSLVMMHEGRRFWNKQLLGSYKADRESHCAQAKLKVSCVLNSPQFFIEEPPKIIEKSPDISIPLEVKKVCQSALKEVTNIPPNPKKKKEKTVSRCEIPTISQIAKNISSITQHFMRRLSSNEQAKTTDNPLKQKIEKALELI